MDIERGSMFQSSQLQDASSSHHHISRHTLKVDPQPKCPDC